MALQINAVFRRVTEKDEWGAGFLIGVRLDSWRRHGGGALTIRSQLGYTGSEQTREDMLRNSHFVDAEVELFEVRVRTVEARRRVRDLTPSPDQMKTCR